MIKSLIYSSVFIGALCSYSAIASADTTPGGQPLICSTATPGCVRALENQIKHLATNMRAMQADLNRRNLAPAEPTAKPESADVGISMGPSPKFTKGNFTWKPRGRIQLDYAVFDDDNLDHPNGATFRRARLGMQGSVAKNFNYLAEVDFANNGVSLKGVWLNYTGFDHTEIRLGNFNPGNGLENLTGANDLTFIERSAATNAFTLSETLGAGVFFSGEQWSLSFGAFNDSPGTQSDQDEAWLLNTRGVFAPINDETTTIHLGAFASHRKPAQDELNNNNDNLRFSATAENALQRRRSVDTNYGGSPYIDTVDSANMYGLEAALVVGPFSLQGEYMFADVNREDNSEDVNFDGGYVQGSYFFTGERRPYSPKYGQFSRIKPKSPLDSSGYGAWEMAARYSVLDLSDKDVRGGEMDNYTVGLNWYPHSNVKFMANYIAVDTDTNDTVASNDDPHIFLLRSQVDF